MPVISEYTRDYRVKSRKLLTEPLLTKRDLMKTINNVYMPLFFGTVLCLFSGWMTGYAARVSLAQQIHHAAKYGIHKDAASEELSDYWERSTKLYPHNYHLYIWAAEKCWYSRYIKPGVEDTSRLTAAGRWCSSGLKANYYSSQLRLLKTHLIERESVADAVEYWEDYVDWHFWSPYNHVVLVDLYVKAGDFVRASESLEWVRNSKYYKEASRKLDDAWQKEMSM